MPLDRSNTQKRDPLTNFQFRVCIGEEEYGFSKISGLRRERENFTIQEGGLNDRVYVLPGPTKRGGTVVLERGVYSGEYFPFYLVGEYIPNSMTIELWDQQENAKQKKVYRLVNLVVKSWEAGDLDASQNQVFIDRMELDYGYLCIEVK